MLKSLEAKKSEFMNIPEKDITKQVCLKAKMLRLEYANVRIQTEKIRKQEKEFYLIGWKAVDWISSIVKFAIQEDEEKMLKIEKHFEIKETERIEKLQNVREQEVAKYEVNWSILELWQMTGDVYSNFLTGVKTNFEARKEAEKKAEKDRKAKEKKELEEQKRIKKENIKLQKEAKDREEQAEKEREEARIIQEEKEKELEQEREIVRKKQEELDRIKEKQEEQARLKKEQEYYLKQAEETRKKEQERLEKEENYKKFIKDNEGKFDKIIKEDWKVVLYKKVSEFII